MDKLQKIQLEINGEKDCFNDFGKFAYRNAESLYKQIKPLLDKYGCYLTMDNDLIQMGDKQFIKSIATFIDGDFKQSATAFAAIDFELKGMNYCQATGSAISYSNKYALCNLFLLSDASLDADAQEPKQSQPKQQEQQPKQKNNVDVEEIRNAQSIDELKRLYNRVEKVESEKAREFLKKELTIRKQHLIAKNVKSTIK